MGGFNYRRFLDPLGATIGKGTPGSPLDPLGAFDKNKGAGAGGAADAGPTVPNPVPPANRNSAAVAQAEHDLASRNMLKKSVKKTIIAGDTGGYSPRFGGPTAASFGGP